MARSNGGAETNGGSASRITRVNTATYDELLGRTYAAKTMVRPLMKQLGDYVNASVSPDPNDKTCNPGPGQVCYHWSGDGGNPLLRPWRADAYDIAIDKYFSPASYFSIAGFYKHFTSFIYDAVGNNNYNFSGLNIARGYQLNTSGRFSNFWSWFAELHYRERHFDDPIVGLVCDQDMEIRQPGALDGCVQQIGAGPGLAELAVLPHDSAKRAYQDNSIIRGAVGSLGNDARGCARARHEGEQSDSLGVVTANDRFG